MCDFHSSASIACCKCRYYLRSLGANPRKEPSDIGAAFRDLAADLRLPQPPASDSFFSSVLRISSGEQGWIVLHSMALSLSLHKLDMSQGCALDGLKTCAEMNSGVVTV